MTCRAISRTDIESAVMRLCLEANIIIRDDISRALEILAGEKEQGEHTRRMVKVLLDNATIARDKKIAICQDTGLVCVFIEIGDNVSVCGINMQDAVNKGVMLAYKEYGFRMSVVGDPVIRKNTGSNIPAILHVEIVPGDTVKISVMPKGFGSENKGRIGMLKPTSGVGEIVDFCVETVKLAGPDACPPYILGVGIGGTMEYCAYLAKKALLRKIDRPNAASHLADIETRIRSGANALDIGIMGLGGSSTVIGVNVEAAATHIAGLPVAVNLSCHALRTATTEI
ncbi:MAG: fumarate hydratase [Candidatus Omnitrophica bacterium]|nr:fumarate hydratase [Candidatus Omnitrophota bacterium]MDD5488937.1 fumarate hydratase [Candidatus Omnitrophota bacterium]